MLTYLVRHALRVPDNAAIPKKDLPLSEAGFAQAREIVGPKLREDIERQLEGRPYKIKVVISPDLRAQQTVTEGIKPALEGLDVEYFTDERLREINDGLFYGVPKSKRSQRWPRETEMYNFLKHEADLGGKEFARPPGENAECQRDVIERVGELHRELGDPEYWRPSKGVETVVVFVTHKYIVSMLAMFMKMESLAWFNNDPGPEYGAIRKFSSPGNLLICMDDQGYLYEGIKEKEQNWQRKTERTKRGRRME